ncbi:unnamed protein product [Caenorhabditis sp. 36 PRJEB53466]|nr:unnamed protein product [Caenorhabditis sp. 36 PRJEB53466]
MCFSEIFIGRLFTYVPALCPILSPYFYSPSVFLKVYFTLIHYTDGFKTISQVFLSFNRMTCVVFPVNHDEIWKRILIPTIFIMFILPIGIIWNIVISRVYANPSAGGFSANYIRKVVWARVSQFHLFYFIGSLLLIIIFSSATLYALLVLRTRIKSAEKSITTATMAISIEFCLLAMFQIYFAYLSSPTSPLRPYLLRALELTYDSLNFFPPILLICFNRQLRKRQEAQLSVHPLVQYQFGPFLKWF